MKSSYSILPGFSLSLGYSVSYLSLCVLFPLSALLVAGSTLRFEEFWRIVSAPEAVSAYMVSLRSAFFAATINSIFGTLLAWVLVRDDFFGKSIVDALVDLPFALPTAVAGITLATLYAEHGWLGQFLSPLGLSVAYTPTGIVVALVFVTLPFVVRTLQPVIEDLSPDVEEAARTLGASRFQVLTRVILPMLFPAWLTAFSLAFSRALGEYGSVIFIAGNLPFISEITPFLIISKFEQQDLAGATALALVMLGASFILLLLINMIQNRLSRAFLGERL